jgi:hypothetical protein
MVFSILVSYKHSVQSNIHGMCRNGMSLLSYLELQRQKIVITSDPEVSKLHGIRILPGTHQQHAISRWD